jgi:hypothetical protein
MRLHISDESEWIYDVDEQRCSLHLQKGSRVPEQKGAKKGVRIVAHGHGAEYFSRFMWKHNGDCSTILLMSHSLLLHSNIHIFRRKISIDQTGSMHLIRPRGSIS